MASHHEGFDSVQWRVHVARLRSFLRHARAVRDQADDARDKAEEEYIFDRRYVESLVDRAVEHLEALVFDARVLGVGTGDLDRALGECLRRTRDLYHRDADVLQIEPATPAVDVDPEYALLAAVTVWLEGPARGPNVSAMDLVHASIDAVVEAVSGTERSLVDLAPNVLELPGSSTLLRIADLGGGLGSPEGVSPRRQDIHCQPLGLMLMGADHVLGGADGGSGPGSESWLAVVDSNNLSLRGSAGGSTWLVEAMVTGRREADWVFFTTTDPAEIVEPLPGIRIEQTGSRQLLWSAGHGAVHHIDETLIELGGRLFRGSGSLVQRR